jgi:hypothetical protein
VREGAEQQVRLPGGSHGALPELDVLPTAARRHLHAQVDVRRHPRRLHPGLLPPRPARHVPKDHAEYSVYITEEDIRRNVSVEERLRRIRPDAVERMRGAVVRLIPSMIYSDTSSKLESTVDDAFDVAVEAVARKVTKIRKRIVEGPFPRMRSY